MQKKKIKKIQDDAYIDPTEGLADTDTRILDRSLRKQTKFDRWLWNNIALTDDGSIPLEVAVYQSAGDLKMSSVTTRRYILERVYMADADYGIVGSMLWWKGATKR